MDNISCFSKDINETIKQKGSLGWYSVFRGGDLRRWQLMFKSQYFVQKSWLTQFSILDCAGAVIDFLAVQF